MSKPAPQRFRVALPKPLRLQIKTFAVGAELPLYELWTRIVSEFLERRSALLKKGAQITYLRASGSDLVNQFVQLDDAVRDALIEAAQADSVSVRAAIYTAAMQTTLLKS